MNQKVNLNIIDNYYLSRCNEEWEHFYGINIESCDNPGWILKLSDPLLIELHHSENYKNIIKKIMIQYDVIIDTNIKDSVTEGCSLFLEICIFGKSLSSVINSLNDIFTNMPLCIPNVRSH